MKLKPVEMDFTYNQSYTEAIPEAYEALLLDVLNGDATLFMRADQVETAWKGGNAHCRCMEEKSLQTIAVLQSRHFRTQSSR
jgi:glucose-6-phosphate 1-dehydrogenase